MGALGPLASEWKRWWGCYDLGPQSVGNVDAILHFNETWPIEMPVEKNGAPIKLMLRVGNPSNDPLGMRVVRRPYQLHKRIANALQM